LSSQKKPKLNDEPAELNGKHAAMETDVAEPVVGGYRLTSGPYFSYFSLLFDPEPYFSLLLRKQPYYPYFLGCHVVNLNKNTSQHVFLH